ncbi:hypothetical protein ACFVTY_30420 [Streptomyces sp. NPDC058067]|uniref:hypothetical protein n=1 Tax=Streptomyces sp. NPDC058067 TaxID=3346324 RepID=UPI0036EF8520
MTGTIVIGNHNTVNNLNITAESGSTLTVHGGPLPDPVRRPSISQLPRATAEPLIGRARDVHVLQEAVRARQLVQVWGESGVGKSALLRHLACTTARGPEGTAYIEAGGRSADDIAQAIFDISFDAPNYKPSREVLKEHLKTLRLRIYLDDVGLDENELRRLVDMAEHSTFVFTARQRSAVEGVHAIQLAGLTAPAAAELVAALLSRELRPDEAPVVAALRDAVDGNPLRLRRIALSAATGKGLPGIADLPGLLPALLNKLQPQERDLLYLLGSLSGAELAHRHLDDLLGRRDTGALADGLVRHGLLLATETGYSCPPDVAECVLKSRRTEFPADRLCRAFTAWVEARDTTPDDVAAHYQALDVAVLRAERSGHARLGAALARAASPKLALSRQFDAWGSLLGVGWAAAKSAGDKAGEEFFLREARARKRAIGRITQAAVLGIEAGVLMHELVALHAHMAGGQIAATMSAGTQAIPAAIPGAVQAPVTPVLTHGPAATSVGTAHAHAATSVGAGHAHAAHVARPVIDMSSASAPSHAATHAAHASATAAQGPPPIDLSGSAVHSHPATTSAAGTSHPALTAGGAASAKGGVSALALACTIGVAAVLGVGAMAYMNDQPSPSPTVAADPIGTPGPIDDTSASADPVCASVLPDLSSESGTFNTDSALASSAIDSYNTAMASYNSGSTSTPPDDSMFLTETGTVVSDLEAFETTLQEATAQAQDSSVSSDLADMLTATRDIKSQYESFGGDQGSSQIDTTSQVSDLNSAWSSLQTDCGA